MVVEWIMKTSTSDGKHGIQRTAGMQRDDLDFTDDLTILFHIHQEIQAKKTSVAKEASTSVGLNMHQ